MSTTNMTHHEEIAQHSAGRPTNFKHRLVRRFIGAAVGLVLAITSVGLTAPAAQAASAQYSIKQKVTIYSGPGTTYPIIGSAAAGQKVSFECWGTGPSINGDNIWGYVAGGQGIQQGYIADWYINIGGKRLNQVGIHQCGSYTISATVQSAAELRSGPGNNFSSYGYLLKIQPITRSQSYRPGLLPSGSTVVFDCWAAGQSIQGNNVWGRVRGAWNPQLGNVSIPNGYVADYYINLGGKTLKSMGLPSCW